MATATVKKKLPKVPKSLAACADLLYTTRAERLTLDKESKAYKKLETELCEKLIDELPKSQASGIAGKLARATINTKEVYEAQEWEKIYNWVIDEAVKHRRKKTGLEHSVFDIFQRTLVQSALEERFARGERVAGVGTFIAVKVGLNKV